MNTALEIVKPESTTLTKQEETTATLMRRATDVAGVCKQIVLKTAIAIQGRKYVRVEGWQAIATAHGCIASAKDVEKVDGGWKAIGELRRMSDGIVLANAEGFVGVDETKTWAQRPEYACRAMAQTRAISRVCRSAFAHVVVLMDAGLSTTPAEEVPDSGFTYEAHSERPESQKPAPTPVQTPRKATPETSGEPVGQTIGGVTTVECEFDSYKVIESKPDAPKKWRLFACKFNTLEGSQFEASTFDVKIGEILDTLVGSVVALSHKPGRKENTKEIVSISPSDNVAF